MKSKKCKQCENPNLKGLHTCAKYGQQHRALLRKKKKSTLVERLRAPLIDYDGKPDGKLMIDKINAIGEAVALLMEDYQRRGDQAYEQHCALDDAILG